jgi:hypothetical protein
MNALDNRLILGSDAAEVGHEVLRDVAPRNAVDAGPDVVVELFISVNGTDRRLGRGSDCLTPLLFGFVYAAVVITDVSPSTTRPARR